MKRFDVIVIGGGAGGLTVAVGAASLGAKVALIEKNDKLGGDCLHYGCVPSKTLIEVATQVFEADQLESLGVQLSGTPDIKKVMDRVSAAIEIIQHQDSTKRFEKLGIEVVFGAATFVSPHEITVNSKIIYGKKIVIATGSSPFVPDVEGLHEVGFLTNESLFGLDKLPQRLVVVGAGAVGLELGQAMSRLGSEVVLIDRSDSLLSKEDEEVAEAIHTILENEVTFLFNTSLKKVEVGKGCKLLTAERDGESTVIEADEILVAIGRVPNTSKLSLHAAGVATDSNGQIKVNAQLQTNIPHIYAVGDVNGTLPFTHVAGMEGKHVVQNILSGLNRKINYSNVPWVIYTYPEIFHLGLTEQEAKENHQDIKIYKVPLSDVDRFVTDHKTEGFVKIITDKKGYILGAHAIGKHAGDWMQEVVFAKQFKKKIGSISSVIHPYPNHSTAVLQTADSYWRKNLFEGRLQRIIKKYVQWRFK